MTPRTHNAVKPSQADLDHTRRQFRMAVEQILAHQPAGTQNDGPHRRFRAMDSTPSHRRLQS
jgi:hypothetical protein